MAAMFFFEHDGTATPAGFTIADGREAPLRRIPRKRASYLRDQGKRGPWIEHWQPIAGHPYAKLLGDLKIKAHAYAPIRDGAEVIGILVVGAGGDAEQSLSAALPALIEFATISGTMIGPKVAALSEISAARANLTAIIASQRFHAVFQPIVDIETMAVMGYEGLTRFDDGVPPESRFAQAADLGMSAELEIAAIQSVLAAARDLPTDGWLNINASSDVVINTPSLRALLRHETRSLVLEVTEHEAIADYALLRAALDRVGADVRLAIDDAGSGYASMRHIIELQPSFVKIDRTLITGIDKDPARRALVAAMRSFARTSGFWLIAEGVETEEELATLRGLEIRYAQGYLLGLPQRAQVGAASDTPVETSASSPEIPNHAALPFTAALPVSATIPVQGSADR